MFLLSCITPVFLLFFCLLIYFLFLILVTLFIFYSRERRVEIESLRGKGGEEGVKSVGKVLRSGWDDCFSFLFILLFRIKPAYLYRSNNKSYSVCGIKEDTNYQSKQ
ncbi:hypothetical protein M501DRAFT_223658 [Patellaria atrata CBS 101060]|uniref:Uncharacterized protein n=1 Tax=Patellaria atrata CBS 101060 TaxID=1346257 RepID=A0A9P4VKS9_9PEZI|nr:hypothetical protein M501DRAFT_223658 [Patellaria atrata CBS 101060]